MSLPQSFKAAVVEKPKAKHAILDRSLSDLEQGEVAIKITAAAINPVDWKMRDHSKFIDEYPAILGSDAAGIVVATASDVKDLQVDDRVFFQGIIGINDSSTFQQYCRMPAVLVAKTPEKISDDEAATISLTLMAAATAFYDKAGHGLPAPWKTGGEEVGKGKAVVILGGSSSVGQAAIQLARLSGFEKIITNASALHHDYLKEIGANIVLDRDHSDPDDFKAAIGDLPLEFVFDAISGKSTQILAVKTARASHVKEVITVHVVDPEVPNPEAVALSQNEEPKVEIKQILGIGSKPELRHLSEPLVSALGGDDGWIAKGLFKPARPKIVDGGLKGLEEALELNKKGMSGEKAVIRPFDN